jgi:hypothetical protein
MIRSGQKVVISLRKIGEGIKISKYFFINRYYLVVLNIYMQLIHMSTPNYFSLDAYLITVIGHEKLKNETVIKSY